MATWDTNYIYDYTKFLCHKNQAGGISSKDLFSAWNSEQSATQEDLLGRWQARANGKSGINTGMIQDETVLTKLSPFTITYTMPIVSGYGAWPDDFIYGAALRINGAKVYHFNKDQRWAIDSVENVIDPPSIDDDCYYFTESGKGFKFLPITATSAELDYIAACTDIVWAYDLDGNNRPIYNAANSVNPKWNTNTIIEITRRTLKSFGLHFSDQSMEEFGNSNINTGD